MRSALAWGVHLFTAFGAVVAAWALLAIAQREWQAVVLLMLAGLTIDAVDGMMARAAGVESLTPRIDGRRLDDIVDFSNYAIVPVVFMVAAGLLPHWAWAAPPILASAYGFSQIDAKTEDGFFLGFPSYWNVVAIYAWLLEIAPGPCAAIVAGLSLLVFVPFKYVHPTRLRVWRGTTYALALLCALTLAYAAWKPERARALHLVKLSLVLPAWYLLLSFRLGGMRRRAGR